MVYSGTFSPDGDSYPLVCIHETLTGNPCPSCGLSHAFSLIIRGRTSEAIELNSYAVRIFLFFSLQLLLRISLPIRFISITGTKARNNLVVADTAVTLVMFMVAFFPLIKFIVISAWSLF
jgi:hypothetical protein